MIAIGTAGWTLPREHRETLPREGSHLERYSRILPCAEINSTFYRAPRPSTWKRWAATVPETFRFAVKAPKTITHEAKLICGTEELQSFLDGARSLGSHLGPILFQLPPKLAFNPEIARAFLIELRACYAAPVVLEPRHATWFSEQVNALLMEFRIARVAADPARVPEAAEPGGWAGLRYFRLHGSPRTYYSPYSDASLAQLARRLNPGDDHETWCIFDNTASGAALGNALDLQQRLAPDRARSSACRLPCRSPPGPEDPSDRTLPPSGGRRPS